MTTDELRNQVIELKHDLQVAKDRLAKRLLEEFPAKAGDVVIHPRLGEYRIERVSARYDGVCLYVRKKTKAGWDKRETNVMDLELGVLNGTVQVIGQAKSFSF